MKVVAIIERAAGNESVGNMWKEVKTFKDSDTLKTVFSWALERTGHPAIKNNIILTIDQSKE